MNASRKHATLQLASAVLCITGLIFALLLSCTGTQQQSNPPSQQAEEPAASQVNEATYGNPSAGLLENVSVSREESFGSVALGISIDDFNKSGFAFGDSIDVIFSNGYELRGIPYYNGYYAGTGEPLVVGYPGYSSVLVALSYGDPLWDVAGLSSTDTATINLNSAGAFHTVQLAFDISYTNERSDYASDEVFANFRPCAGGQIAPNTLYRSASPVDNEYNRAAYSSALMKQASVRFILDLSDNDGEVDEFIALDEENSIDVSPFLELWNAGNVATLDLSASYPSPSYEQSLAAGLVTLSQHDGPYLVHCIEGKDRTGFVCILLEALCGASYDEIVADYMETYANYYGITAESNPERYDAIRSLNCDGMLQFLAGVDGQADLASLSFVEPAKNYLRTGGMTDEQIDALRAKLTAQQ